MKLLLKNVNIRSYHNEMSNARMQGLKEKVKETDAAAAVTKDLGLFEPVCATCFLEDR